MLLAPYLFCIGQSPISLFAFPEANGSIGRAADAAARPFEFFGRAGEPGNLSRSFTWPL
jgi:hypothetical protein